VNVALESPALLASDSFHYVPRALLAILRVYLGVILLITNLGKLTRDNPFATEMLGFLRGATRRASAPYLHFLQQVVIPHSTLFSYLVMTGEAVAALSLLTGTMTRVGAAIAMFLFLNYNVGQGPHVLVAGQSGRRGLLHRTRGIPRSRRSSVGSRPLSREALAEISALVMQTCRAAVLAAGSLGVIDSANQSAASSG
jgi:uncharacterized membrane protein YphA (DoxX/SURF4 family)